MNKNYYDIYLSSIFKLASTLCIKSLDAAEAINDNLIVLYGNNAVALSQPETWKYYLNISGEYHTTDQLMSVTSLDTLEIITFTKANLLLHKSTRAAYEFGTRYYYSLLKAYPEQEQLILGILYPADLATAIGAAEGTVLSYPPELVEPQEATLIHDLENWTKGIFVRWHVRGFSITDTLYSTAHHAIMYMQLVPKILNLRLARCMTIEAHSFHIREYLASNQGLDKYLPYLTIKQSLFLYRNIIYINNNAGKNETLMWLVDRILTERFIPVFEYSMKHKGLFDTKYKPEYIFRRKPLNNISNNTNITYHTLDDILVKEYADGLDTAVYAESEHMRIDNLFKSSSSNVVKTKIIESEMLDMSDGSLYTLPDILLNHWAYLSAEHLYNTVIHFTDPKTSDIVSLLPEDAFIYMIYLLNKALGITMVTVPGYTANRVLNTSIPSLATLNSMVSSTYIPNNDIQNWLISNRPALKNLLSVDSFFVFGQHVFDYEQQHIRLLSSREEHTTRAQVSKMIESFFIDTDVVFTDTGTLMSNWVIKNGIKDVVRTLPETMDLVAIITAAATGYNINDATLIKNIQANMIGVMKDLNGYDVQFIATINQAPIKPIMWPAIRAGNFSIDMANILNIVLTDISPISVKGMSSSISTFDVNPPNTGFQLSPALTSNESAYLVLSSMSPAVTLFKDPTRVIMDIVNTGCITINAVVNNVPVPDGEIMGYNFLNTLTDADRLNFVDVYKPIIRGL